MPVPVARPPADRDGTALRRRAAAGVRAATLVTLIAATVAACVSTGGDATPDKPTPAAGSGSATDGRHAGHGSGPGGHGGTAARGGLSPSPTVSGTGTASAVPATATGSGVTSLSPGRLSTRGLPLSGHDGSAGVPKPTAQPSSGGGSAPQPADPTPGQPSNTATADPPPPPGPTSSAEGSPGGGPT